MWWQRQRQDFMHYWGWIFFRGQYFPGVNIFQEWIFFSFPGVNIFQGWLFFRSEYFSGVNIFRSWLRIFLMDEYFSRRPDCFESREKNSCFGAWKNQDMQGYALCKGQYIGQMQHKLLVSNSANKDDQLLRMSSFCLSSFSPAGGDRVDRSCCLSSSLSKQQHCATRLTTGERWLSCFWKKKEEGEVNTMPVSFTNVEFSFINSDLKILRRRPPVIFERQLQLLWIFFRLFLEG